MSNTPFVSLATFNRSKKIIALLFACLSFLAVSLRADDSVIQSSDDLSAADKVAAEHLQKQMDAENKAAHDKAERDDYKEHHPGDDSSGLIVPAIVVLIVVGAIIYWRNKTAGNVFAGCCATIIVFVAILVLTEKPPLPVQPAIQPEATTPSPQDTANAAKAVKAELAESLQKELAASKEAVAKKIQRLNWVKQQVTHFWQQYQADSTIFNPATGAYDKRPDYKTDFDGKGIDGSSQYYYEKWLAAYQTESNELTQQKQHVTELQTSLFHKTGLIDSDGIGGIDPSTGLPMSPR